MNKVMLIGNVGQDPTVRYLDTGICVASVRLATTERGYTLENGTSVPDRTEWHTVIFWRRLGEIVEKYVHKGDKMYVEGKIQTRTYDDRQGVRRQVVEIMADNMELLSPRSTQDSAPATSAASTAPIQQATATTASSAPAVQPQDEEMPF